MSAIDWVYCMQKNDVEHYTERSDERRKVFEDAASTLSTDELSPVIWAFLQVGDLEQVKNLTSTHMWSLLVLENNGKEAGINYMATDAIRLWKQKDQEKTMATTNSTPGSAKRKRSEAFASNPKTPVSSNGPSTPASTTAASLSITRSNKPLGSAEYSVRRDPAIVASCKQRDHGLCVVSRKAAVDACHIYPWCAFGNKASNRVERFWAVLRFFWPADKVTAWQEKIFRDDRHDGRRGTETIENMLSLTATLHRFHSAGAFALRPVRRSSDNTQLELEFHWLARQEERKPKMDLMDEPLSSRDLKGSSPGYHFARIENGVLTLLHSGTRFTMTTDDPDQRPLPDSGLLELQWHLQRILAMSGAAGWREEEFGDNESATGAAAVITTVEQWLDDGQLTDDQYHRGLSSSPSESVEVVDGAFDETTE